LTARKTVFVHSPQFERYQYPPDYPFKVSRAGRLQKIINSMGLLTGEFRCEVAPEPAKRDTLEKFHSKSYLDALQAAAKGDFSVELLDMGIGTPDCPIFSDMYDYSVLACGATLTAANLILSQDAELAFNPSGGLHHAGPQSASGFCYINDVAIGCLVLAEAGKRVLYLDVDAHHGDGVQNVFYDRADVMTISFHQDGKTLFPGTGFEDEIGTGAGKGFCVNVPLPVGTDDKAYMEVFEAIALPLAEAYKPDVIVFELGADALAGDPLARLKLTNNTYADIIYKLLGLDKPILMTGGGGYNINNTVRAWALAWSILCGADLENQHANAGLGGVMLESTDWYGGLRDRQLLIDKQLHSIVTNQLKTTIDFIRANVFPLHRL